MDFAEAVALFEEENKRGKEKSAKDVLNLNRSWYSIDERKVL